MRLDLATTIKRINTIITRNSAPTTFRIDICRRQKVPASTERSTVREKERLQVCRKERLSATGPFHGEGGLSRVHIFENQPVMGGMSLFDSSTSKEKALLLEICGGTEKAVFFEATDLSCQQSVC